jgi:hypothetical protein
VGRGRVGGGAQAAAKQAIATRAVVRLIDDQLVSCRPAKRRNGGPIATCRLHPRCRLGRSTWSSRHEPAYRISSPTVPLRGRRRPCADRRRGTRGRHGTGSNDAVHFTPAGAELRRGSDNHRYHRGHPDRLGRHACFRHRRRRHQFHDRGLAQAPGQDPLYRRSS